MPTHAFSRKLNDWKDIVRLIGIKINHEPLLAEKHRPQIEQIDGLLETLYADVLALQPEKASVSGRKSATQNGHASIPPTTPHERNKGRLKDKKKNTNASPRRVTAATSNNQDEEELYENVGASSKALSAGADPGFERNEDIFPDNNYDVASAPAPVDRPFILYYAQMPPTEYVMIIKSQEDTTKVISAGGQPPYIKLPLETLKRESTVLAAVLQDKSSGKLKDEDDKIVYNGFSSRRYKEFINDKVVYLDGLFASEYVWLLLRKRNDRFFVEDLGLDRQWDGVKALMYWVKYGKVRVFGEHVLDEKGALLVAKALGADAFLAALKGAVGEKKTSAAI